MYELYHDSSGFSKQRRCLHLFYGCSRHVTGSSCQDLETMSLQALATLYSRAPCRLRLENSWSKFPWILVFNKASCLLEVYLRRRAELLLKEHGIQFAGLSRRQGLYSSMGLARRRYVYITFKKCALCLRAFGQFETVSFPHTLGVFESC